MRAWWLVFVWLVALAAFAEAPGSFSTDLEVEQYDCTVTVRQPARPTPGLAVRLYLDWRDARNCTMVAISDRQLLVATVREGMETQAGTAPGLSTGAHTVCVLRRGGWLGLEVDGRLVFRGDVPRAAGAEAGVTAEGGWTAKDACIQRIDPVNLADNFMRTADEAGVWRTVSGAWGLQSAWDEDPHGNGDRFGRVDYAQNPFAWVGRGGPALCTAGQPFWDDYTFGAAVRTPERGAVGLAVNMTDAAHGLLARWTAANDRSPGGDRLVLYRMVGAALTQLAMSSGGYIPGQWCRVRVETGPEGVRVFTDGRQRINYTDASPWRGGVGLYADGDAGAVFDDITVYGSALNSDLLDEEEHRKSVARFSDDGQQMMKWAAPNDWTNDVAAGKGVTRFDLYGDERITLKVRLSTVKTGQLLLALRTSPEMAGGIQATVGFSDDGARMVYTLTADGKALATSEEPAPAAFEEYTFRLQQEGNAVWVERDGARVAQATGVSLPAGLRAGYRATGAFYRTREAMALGRNTRDYVFSDAPADWLMQGAWMPASRWACDPKWSFLGGWSRGDAVLWLKQRVSGDQGLETFMGPKMEYPGETEIYEHRYRDMNMSLCTDGRDPRTGYWLAFLPEKDGDPSPRLVLYRNGVELGAFDLTTAGLALPNKDTSHREWFRFRLEKRGAVVTAHTDYGAIRYTDPNPLFGGVPAVWTCNNGIMIARARLSFAETPMPRTDEQVVLPRPSLPRWLNVGTPYALDFGSAWATSGRPVSLRAATVAAPKGDADAPTIANMRMVLAPKAVGEHWYGITATDGLNTSMPCPVALPVFNPARGRDDSRAVVLYRFDEGDGATVRDRSPLGTAADLQIADTTRVRWEPGAGLHVSVGTIIASTGGVPKLESIIAKKTATIECWVSTDTMYPPTSGWTGNIVSWGNPAHRMQNVAIGHQQHNISCSPRGSEILYTGGLYLDHGFRTGLRHWVVTWDGPQTSFYRNGQLIRTAPDDLMGALPWNIEQWDRNAKLFLANSEDGTRGFVGAFHLAAIHDRCLSHAEVLRHYAAGPNAK